MSKETAWKKEEQKRIINEIPDGIFIFETENGKSADTLYMNDAAVEMTGFGREELGNRLKEDPLSMVHPEDRGMLIDGWNWGDCSQSLMERDIRILTAHKQYQWFRMRIKPVSGESNIFYGILFNINELKKNQVDLRIQKEMFEAAVNYSGLRYWEYDIPTKRLYRSQVLQKQVGLEAYIENIPETYVERGLVHPDYVDAYLEFYGKVQRGEDARLIFRSRYENGDWGWLDISYKVLFDEEGKPVKAIGIGGDISETKKKEELYRTSFERMRDICMFVVEQEIRDVLLVDIHTRKMYLYFSNSEYRDGKEYADYNVINKKILRWIVEEDRDRFRENSSIENMVRELEKNPKDGYHFTFRSYDKNKNKVWSEFQCVYFKGNKDMILIFARNINLRVQEEQKRRQKIEEALHEAEVAGRAKEEFLSHMSHEIRTPLNGIKGVLDILKEREELKHDEYLDKAILSTKHLMGILNDILDMSKITSGKIEIHKSWVPRKEFVKEVMAIAEPLAREKGVNLIFESDELENMAYIDRARLKQVMFNLISNGVKYTHRGGTVRIVSIVRPIGDGKIRSETHIIDDGIGMSEEFIQKAFEPFSQEQRDLTQVGTGLGLAITRQLMELMGGTVSIQSEVGKGTDAYFEFETYEKQEETDQTVSDFEQEKRIDYESVCFDGRRCLLVEDNEINADIAQTQLESLGLEVHVAGNGEQAVELFEKSPLNYYDIIFMDVLMPVKDGLTATKEIREMCREDAKKVLIVAMTANAFMDDVNKSLASGMNYHLSKPFDKEQIIDVLIQACPDIRE